MSAADRIDDLARQQITHGDEKIDAFRKGYQAALAASAQQVEGEAVATGPRTEFVLNELRSALNGMMTFFGMDEDENSKPTFDKARQAYNYAEIVMRPLEPWERQSLEDYRRVVRGWHKKAVSKGYDGVEAMCDLAHPTTPTSAAVPAGYKLVPVEPTPDMMAAGGEFLCAHTTEFLASMYEQAETCWRVMLAAAPTQPAGERG